ncbi:hypothetical protein RB608_11925 [Nocardioides sp. LHD-245]|uniref:hypothetical protein n=1 Tax=Nocardioides sp. LHD-245 TaxID=3051387 RepID=UPI0027E1C216|nr:hypothetical protein [Nocardioides sp. LHD-245]
MTPLPGVPRLLSPDDDRAPIDLSAPDELVLPAFWHCPEYAVTIGDEVADLNALFGYAPNPEQRLLLDGNFGMDTRGRLTAFEVFVLAARQNLKTGFFIQRAIGKALLLKRRQQIWTAHKESATDQAFGEFMAMMERSAEFSKRVRKTSEGKGSKSIEFVNDCTIVFRPRTGKAGQSMSADDVDMDEYFAVEAKHEGSLIPTLSTRPNAQVGEASSAPHAGSSLQRAVMARGRAAARALRIEPRMLYAEWSPIRPAGQNPDGTHRYAPTACQSPKCTHRVDVKGCIASSREVIKLANPSAGRSTAPAIAWTFLEDEYRKACSPEATQDSIEEYFKERLSIGVEASGLEESIFPGWPGLKKPVPRTPVVLALGIACDNDQTVLTLGSVVEGTEPPAGSGHPHLAISDRRPATDRQGFAANVARIQKERRCPVLIRGKNFLIDDLIKAGVELRLVDADERAQAHADLANAIETAAVEHGGYEELDTAIAGAQWQVLDNRRVLDSRKGEISALETAALALHGAVKPVPTVEPFALWG